MGRLFVSSVRLLVVGTCEADFDFDAPPVMPQVVVQVLCVATSTPLLICGTSGSTALEQEVWNGLALVKSRKLIGLVPSDRLSGLS